MNKSSIQNFEKWNEYFAKKYDIDRYYQNSNFIIRYIERKRVKEIAELIEPREGDEILELGCGGGHILEKIGKGKLTGVDLSEIMLKKAQEKFEKHGRKVTLIKGNIETLPKEIGNKKFNKIICSEVLEHVEHPDRVIDEILKIGNQGAIIVISIPNEKFINFLKQIFIKLKIFQILFPNISKKADAEYHLHSFNLALLKEITQEKFKIEKIKPIPFWFLPIRYVIKFKPWGK